MKVWNEQPEHPGQYPGSPQHGAPHWGPSLLGMCVMDPVSDDFPGWGGLSPHLLGYEDTSLPLYQLPCCSWGCSIISPSRGLAYAPSECQDFQVCTLYTCWCNDMTWAVLSSPHLVIYRPQGFIWTSLSLRDPNIWIRTPFVVLLFGTVMLPLKCKLLGKDVFPLWGWLNLTPSESWTNRKVDYLPYVQSFRGCALVRHFLYDFSVCQLFSHLTKASMVFQWEMHTSDIM